MGVSDGPLTGIRVLDLSRVLAGPWATQLLADLGAEVIKIERHGEGDDTRGWGPPFHGDPADGRSAYFLSANRGKQSVTLDLANPAGQEAVRRLAATSDVLIENFRTGGLAAYSLDYPSLSPANPRLVYCSITGFGHTGPLASRAGYDVLIQGMGGLMSVTGDVDGPPTKVGVAIVDVMTGLYAANAIQAALIERARSGLGQHIDLALFDVQLATLANQAANHLIGGTTPGRLGNAHPSIVPYQTFATADGHVIVAVGNDAQYARYAAACGLAPDPRFARNADRVRLRATLVPHLAHAMALRTTAAWIATLEPLGVPCGPVNDVAQALAEPQAVARGMVVEADGVRAVGTPLRFSRSVTADPSWPDLGQHTEAVLTRLLGADAVSDLRRRGAFSP